MTVTPWIHAPIEDSKRPTKQPSNRRKTTKEEKTLFKGAYVSFTTGRSRVIRGLTIQQVAYISTRGLYHWQVVYHRRVDSIESRVYQTRHATVQSASRVWVEKIPKKVKQCLREAGEVFYQTYKLFLSGKKDLKIHKKAERKTKKPQTDKALPNEVASSVVKEIFLWL